MQDWISTNCPHLLSMLTNLRFDGSWKPYLIPVSLTLAEPVIWSAFNDLERLIYNLYQSSKRLESCLV